MFISGRSAVWIYVLMYWLVSTLFLFYIPTAANFEYTYQLNTVAPGNLYSQRWTYDFWIVGMFVFVWVIPLTLIFAMDSMEVGTRWRMTMHLIITILYMLWLAAALFYGVFGWANANSSNPDNYTNRFNDPRYCCVYHVPAQAFCYIHVDCIPEPQASDLITNGVMLFQWAYNLILLVLLGLDLGIIFTILKPTFDELAVEEIERAKANPSPLELQLLDDAQPSRRTRTRQYRGRQ